MRVATLVRVVGVCAIALFTLVAFTPAPNLVNRWTSRQPILERAAAIVVLGGGGAREDGTLSDVSLRRTVVAVALYRREFAPLIVFSGMSVGGRSVEAEARARFASEVGVPAGAIITEATAQTTRQEAQRIGQLLLPRGHKRILLVADSQGMRRAVGVFERVGFEVLPAPTDDVEALGGSPEGRLQLTRSLVMEAAALLYYRVAGYL